MNNQNQRRRPEYISPSQISCYRKDPEEYYTRYIAVNKSHREPQTQAMSIGSAFDAYAKSYLHQALFGKGNDPKYGFDALFCAQVEEQWRDWAKLHGMYVFDAYRQSGALADLLSELQQAVNAPKFEIDIRGVINDHRESVIDKIENVVLLGKPDVFFINKHAANVILDWKVNGYVSKYKKSPTPGYVRLRGDSKKDGPHTDAKLAIHHGVLINTAQAIHEINIDWGTQLSIYAWLSGCAVGGDYIAGIDQIVCSNNGSEFPDLRFAEHRSTIPSSFQFETFALAKDLWDRINNGHYFREMSIEDSEARCTLLDTQVLELAKMDDDFLELTQRRIR